MSSNFWNSSHLRYWLIPRSTLLSARTTDLKYATPRQLYCLGIWFSNLIQKLGKRLQLRQVPIATANVFFRRFYLKNSYCETNPYLVLAACCFVAAKVEETPVHIKSVVSEAKMVFTEANINAKMFPAETNKLGEMEFYLMEDLDFHLVVFHPYRALLHMSGREPADAGRYEKTRVEEDVDIKKAEGEARRKRDEEIRRAGPGAGVGSRVMEELGGGAEEGEAERIRRLMGRGSGEGLMEIDEGVLQICLFLINDTYRTDVHLLYPPYLISLAVIYIGFCLTAMNNPSGTRTRSSSSQINTLAHSLETNTALSLPPPPAGAAEFLASFEVSLPVLLACVQDIIVLYPIWEAFEPSSTQSRMMQQQQARQQQQASMGSAGGMNLGKALGGLGGASGGAGGGMGGAAGGGAGASGGPGSSTGAAPNSGGGRASSTNGLGETLRPKDKFGPEEAEALVRRMIEERMVDVGHPANAGEDTAAPPLIGKKRARP